MDRRILYYSGIASVIVYIIADIIGGIITPNFSYAMNAVSELSQTGAENRLLLGTIGESRHHQITAGSQSWFFS